MDSLHLTYQEVVYTIPYRNLVIMQKDKLRTCYGDKIVEMSADEEEAFFARKVAKAQFEAM